MGIDEFATGDPRGSEFAVPERGSRKIRAFDRWRLKQAIGELRFGAVEIVECDVPCERSTVEHPIRGERGGKFVRRDGAIMRLVGHHCSQEWIARSPNLSWPATAGHPGDATTNFQEVRRLRTTVS